MCQHEPGEPELAAVARVDDAAGSRIDFVVMMWGTPYLISGGGSFNGFSVDGVLTQATGAFPTSGGNGNPYFGATTPFSYTLRRDLAMTASDMRT